jgi:hypothetical protein
MFYFLLVIFGLATLLAGALWGNSYAAASQNRWTVVFAIIAGLAGTALVLL